MLGIIGFLMVIAGMVSIAYIDDMSWVAIIMVTIIQLIGLYLLVSNLLF